MADGATLLVGTRNIAKAGPGRGASRHRTPPGPLKGGSGYVDRVRTCSTCGQNVVRCVKGGEGFNLPRAFNPNVRIRRGGVYD